MQEGQPSRREFLKGAGVVAVGAMVPEELLGQETWPKELLSQVERLEASLRNFNQIKDQKLRKAVVNRAFPELKGRIQETKDNATAETIAAMMKNKETKEIEVLYDRIEKVEKEIQRIENEVR